MIYLVVEAFSVVFFVITALMAVFLTWLSDEENITGSTVYSFILGALLLCFTNIFQYMKTLTWYEWTIAILTYLFVGFWYSCAKWRIKVNKIKEEFDKKDKSSFGRKTWGYDGKWFDIIEKDGVKKLVITVSVYKDWVMYHWFYWPFSLLNFILTDFLTELKNWCFNRVKKFYNWVGGLNEYQ